MVSFWLKSHKMSSGQIHNISVIFFCHRTLHPEPKTYLLSGGYTVRKNTVVFAGPKTKLWNFSVSATGQSPSFNPYWQILENSSRIFFRNFSFPIRQLGLRQKPLKWFCDIFYQIFVQWCCWKKQCWMFMNDWPSRWRQFSLSRRSGPSLNTIGRGSSSDLQNEFSLRSFTNYNVRIVTSFTFIKIEN